MDRMQIWGSSQIGRDGCSFPRRRHCTTGLSPLKAFIASLWSPLALERMDRDGLPAGPVGTLQSGSGGHQRNVAQAPGSPMPNSQRGQHPCSRCDGPLTTSGDQPIDVDNCHIRQATARLIDSIAGTGFRGFGQGMLGHVSQPGSCRQTSLRSLLK